MYIVHVRCILNSVDGCRLVSEHRVTDQCFVTENTSATMFSRFGKFKKGKLANTEFEVVPETYNFRRDTAFTA